MEPNQAAWLKKSGSTLKIDGAVTPVPAADEIVIRNRAIAINPIEVAMSGGLMVETYPTILGSDVAGEVVAIGADITRFQAGDRIIALANSTDNVLTGEERKTTNAAFQRYVATSAKLAAKLPPNIDFVKGCVLPLALSTAAVGLFQKDCLALPHPALRPQSRNGVVFIWGGSSSVGSCAIQLAAATGFDVAATASKNNVEHCKVLGAKYVFDYGQEDVVEEIARGLSGKTLVGGFSTILDEKTIVSTATIISKLSDFRFVQAVLPPEAPVPEGLPAGFKVGRIFGTSLMRNEVGDAVCGDFVSAALANGSLLCKPDPLVVGKGLDKLQVGIEIAEKGVSAQKVVVEID